MPRSVLRVCDGAFSGCRSLSDFRLPDGTGEISQHLLLGCDALSAFTIPESVIEIREGAFQNCKSLLELTVPRDTEKIAADAFADCDNLILSVYSDSAGARFAEEHGFDNHIMYKYIDKPTPQNKGDLNGDWKRTVSDAILLARIVAEDSTVQTTEAMVAAADLDGDGFISASDTTMLLRALAGIK